MRTRSAHDTKRLFRRFLSTTSSTSAPALYPIRTLIRFCCLWRLARIPQNDTHFIDLKIRFIVSLCSLQVRSVSPFLSENVHIRVADWPSAPQTARRARVSPRRCPARTSARRARAARRPLRTSRRRRRPARETRHAPRMPRLGRLGRARGWRGRRRRWLRSRRGCGGTIPRRYPASSHSRRVTPE